MRRHRWILAGLLFVGAATAHAQSQTLLSGPAACRECRIEVERIVAFGDRDGPGMLQEQSAVATDQRGRFYVSSNYDPTIAVFDARGRFLRRIGRLGQGPGEFQGRPLMVFGPGDTLYAIDTDIPRMTVFSPEYNVVRTARLPLPAAVAVRALDGRFLVSGMSRFADGIGYPIHLVEWNGAHIRSFGSPKGEQDLYSPIDALRRIATPRGANVWISKVDAYVLEQWSLEGKKVAQLDRQVPWFPPKVVLPRGANYATHPPPPELRSHFEDSAGFIWTLSIVADEEWQPHTLPPMPGLPGTTYIPDSLRHKLVDSVLEVLDPARGVVLATRRFDTNYMAFIAPNLLVSFDEDADGNPRYVVWRARIVSPTK